MNAELSQLISLQDTDLEIRRLNEEIATLPMRQAQVEEQFAASNREFLDLKAAAEQAQAKHSELEAVLLAEQNKLEKFKADLMKASNEREYTTALREIDVTKKSISAYETETLKVIESLEQLTAQVAERAPEIDTKRGDVDQQLKGFAVSAEVAQTKLAALQADRQSSFESLGPQAKATYQRLSRMRNGIVLAEARDASCTSCRVTIRPQTFNDIKRGDKLFECESCGRILYYRVQQASA